MNDVLQAVSDILRVHCAVSGEIRADSLLQEDLGLDSMGLLTLALETENHFDLCLDEPPDQPPQRVSEIVELVKTRLAEKS